MQAQPLTRQRDGVACHLAFRASGYNTAGVTAIMDMTAPINPLILETFYALLIKEAVLVALLIVLFTVISRLAKPAILRFWIDSTDELPHSSDLSASGEWTSARIRRGLATAFGCLWILDGMLQAQPEMTTQFLSGVVKPLISGLPGILPNLLSPALYVWNLHALLFDSLSAILQVLIGAAILVGPHRRLGRLGLYVSFAWSLVIWVFGEGFGGLFNSPTWLTGMPGSAALYAVAATFLMMPPAMWAGRTVRRGLSAVLGVLWFLFAVFQAWPRSGFWGYGGLSNALLPMAQMSQPEWTSAPLYAVANTVNQAPVLYNGVAVAILTVLALLWLLRPRTRGLVSLSALWLLLTWWIGQDFGVVGGLGTDPNTALPMLILTLTAGRLLRQSSDSDQLPAPQWPLRAVWLYGTALITAVLCAAIVLFGQYLELSATAAAIAPALNETGITETDMAIPKLTFVNQHNDRVSLQQFRGKAIVLVFLDPVCYDVCPLFAAEMAQADRLLGAEENRVEMVAICANPIFHSVDDLRRFDAEMHLNSLPNWEYLTADDHTLTTAWHDFYEYVSVEPLGMVDHADDIYFISPDGRVKDIGLLSEQASLSGSTSSLMADYAAKLLHESLTGLSATPVDLNTYHLGIPHAPGFDQIDMITRQSGFALRTAGPYEEVLHTINAGRTWLPVTPDGISQRGGLLLYAISDRVAWVIIPPYGYNANATLFVTENGGATWQPTGEPGPLPALIDMRFRVAGAHTLLLSGRATPTGPSVTYSSTDFGASWRKR